MYIYVSILSLIRNILLFARDILFSVGPIRATK
ncbi:hypothetical protein AEAC466_11805 [Asticcacaulis sp. AC466]|nr:hypothetical protein AEAC466_11805 [Asticcacaulis sp. AC466]